MRSIERGLDGSTVFYDDDGEPTMQRALVRARRGDADAADHALLSLASGSVPWHYARVMVRGEARSGKTSTINAMADAV